MSLHQNSYSRRSIAGFAVYMLNNSIDNVKTSRITTFVPNNNLKKYEFASKFIFKQYRVRKSFPESSAFQYPEKTMDGTKTNNTSAESPIFQL